MMRIRCNFIPQAWVEDIAMEVDPEGPTSWIMTLDEMEKLTGLDTPMDLDDNPYQCDALRYAKAAPQWVQDWSGPFEIKWELLQPGKNT